MSLPSPGTPTPNPVWVAFAARHPGHRHLTVNPLVALPADALDALAKVEGLLDPPDLKFERDLTASVIRGFFHRRPMSSSELGHPRAGYSAERTVEEVFRENGYTGDLSGRGIGEERARVELPSLLVEMREQSLAEKKLPDPAARELQHRRDEVGDRLIRRREAYVGWLVLRPDYNRELRALRARWDHKVMEWGRIPYPATAEGEAAVCTCAGEVGAFCRRWCLERLWAWEWPEPRMPDLASGLPSTPLDPAEGVTLTLPWSMIRGKQIDFHEVVHDLRLEQTPEHLRDWVVSDQPQRRVRSGEIRHRTVFALYRTLTLALHRRHPRSLRRFIERVDAAVAPILNVQVDTLKRTRSELRKGLAAETA